MDLVKIIKVARGEEEADLLLRNAKVVNVFSGDVYDTHVAIAHSRVVGLGDYRAKQEIDLKGAYLAPGFIDSHVHIESSMVSIPEFARAVVPRGTTSVIIDPHEIANVLGLDGIRYMLESSKYNPLSVYVMVPSCVPATHMETAGAELLWYDLSFFWSNEWVLGLGEMMNFPGVLSRDPPVLDKIRAAKGKPIDGHAPGLSGHDLAAYVAAGIGSDHECTTADEAREKLRMGMYVMIREASGARNLADLLPIVTPANSRRCMFATDDPHLTDLLDEGHTNFLIKKAIGLGLDPVTAIQMATLNPAEYFRLHDRGAIAPGRRADLVVFDDFERFNVLKVFRGGRIVAEDGRLLPGETKAPDVPLRSSMNVNRASLDFAIRAEGQRARVIGDVPDQIVTRALVEEVKVDDGHAVADVERDILKLAVIERHLASGNVGLGFVKGFGLKRGAIASSVAHDSHNIIVVGASDADMLAAVRAVVEMRGGIAIVDDGGVQAQLPLPIAGLMSDQPIETVRAEMDRLLGLARQMGSPLHDPLMALSFLALPVIPELRLTDKGLVDVTQFQFVPLFA